MAIAMAELNGAALQLQHLPFALALTFGHALASLLCPHVNYDRVAKRLVLTGFLCLKEKCHPITFFPKKWGGTEIDRQLGSKALRD